MGKQLFASQVSGLQKTQPTDTFAGQKQTAYRTDEKVGRFSILIIIAFLPDPHSTSTKIVISCADHT